MREIVFGGFTQSVLESAEMPVFLMHYKNSTGEPVGWRGPEHEGIAPQAARAPISSLRARPHAGGQGEPD